MVCACQRDPCAKDRGASTGDTVNASVLGEDGRLSATVLGGSSKVLKDNGVLYIRATGSDQLQRSLQGFDAVQRCGIVKSILFARIEDDLHPG